MQKLFRETSTGASVSLTVTNRLRTHLVQDVDILGNLDGVAVSQ